VVCDGSNSSNPDHPVKVNQDGSSKKKKRQHSTSCNWHSYDCNDANKTIIKSNSRLFADGQG